MPLDSQLLRARLERARLYLVLTRTFCRRDPQDVLIQALGAGVDMVQVREPRMGDRDLLAWIHWVRDYTSRCHVPLIVNDRVDLALLSGADGVHLGQTDVPPRAARELLGPERLVGLSTHGKEQVERARVEPVDYLGLGPVFDTATKSLAGQGEDLLREARPGARQPVFPIGGIGRESLAGILRLGVQRAAVCAAVCAAEDPGQEVRFLQEMLA